MTLADELRAKTEATLELIEDVKSGEVFGVIDSDRIKEETQYMRNLWPLLVMFAEQSEYMIDGLIPTENEAIYECFQARYADLLAARDALRDAMEVERC